MKKINVSFSIIAVYYCLFNLSKLCLQLSGYLMTLDNLIKKAQDFLNKIKSV